MESDILQKQKSLKNSYVIGDSLFVACIAYSSGVCLSFDLACLEKFFFPVQKYLMHFSVMQNIKK